MGNKKWLFIIMPLALCGSFLITDLMFEKIENLEESFRSYPDPSPCVEKIANTKWENTKGFLCVEQIGHLLGSPLACSEELQVMFRPGQKSVQPISDLCCKMDRLLDQDQCRFVNGQSPVPCGCHESSPLDAPFTKNGTTTEHESQDEGTSALCCVAGSIQSDIGGFLDTKLNEIKVYFGSIFWKKCLFFVVTFIRISLWIDVICCVVVLITCFEWIIYKIMGSLGY